LQELKADKNELELNKSLIFRNDDLDNAIAAVQVEIKNVQAELKKLRKDHRMLPPR
jgi:hypothetical protein